MICVSLNINAAACLTPGNSEVEHVDVLLFFTKNTEKIRTDVMKQNPHVVIIGGGFGGLYAARQLKNTAVQVTLIDRRNFHLFQPLLYQVATGALSPANIATPLRSILRRQKNCNVFLGEVIGFDIDQKQVLLKDGSVNFDFLILAAGSTHSYFGHDEWSTLAPGLKSIEDATEMRRRIFTAFERAERETDEAERRALLTFVVVGGGPTGVELAGALAEIAHHTLTHDFHNIDPSEARIMLVEAAPHILAHYPPELSKKAVGQINSLGIEVRTGTFVADIQPDHVCLKCGTNEEQLQTYTVLWGAGVKANVLGHRLAQATNLECDRGGRVPVQGDLTLAGHPELFVIGDLASCPDENGKPLPGLAPVAMQQGAYVARLIKSRLAGNSTISPFRYRDRGTMATIGRSIAVAQVGTWQFCGFFAWLLWLFIHLMEIIQFQNRMLVFTQWLWNYVTYNRSARLITQVPEPVENSMTVADGVKAE